MNKWKYIYSVNVNNLRSKLKQLSIEIISVIYLFHFEEIKKTNKVPKIEAQGKKREFLVFFKLKY